MKSFGTGNTPFQPANPALDIPEGDPREQTTVTNQALNNPYSEIKNAIEQGGLSLTNVDGTNADFKQLAKSITLVNLNGATFIDAGGSTANVRNLKPLNPNLILPTNPAHWLGANVYFQLFLDGSVATEITVKIYDNTNTLILTSAISSSQNRGSGSNTYLNCIYGSNNKFYIVRGSAQQTKETSGGFTWIYDNTKPFGERDFTLFGNADVTGASVSSFRDVLLPFTATQLNSVTAVPIIAFTGGASTRSDTLVFADIRSYGLNKIGFFATNGDGLRIADYSFSFTLKGKY
jgi:hypothetical protein